MESILYQILKASSIVKNKIDYEEYKEKCIYMLSDKIFTNNVLGKDGAGMLAEEY